MRVIELQDWAVDAIKLAERPYPNPGPYDVVLKMHAASLNYRDHVLVNRGYGRKSGELPLIPVSDGAGEVVETGSKVSLFSVGDRVTPIFAQKWRTGPYRSDLWEGMLGGAADGVMQEFMKVNEQGLVLIPDHLGFMAGASLPCAALTAWSALVTQGQIGAGDFVVIQGTGGVSLFALQFAKLMGATVLLTSSSEAKLEKGKKLGADYLVNYRAQPEWSRQVKEISEGKGATHIVEVGGANTLEQSIKAIAANGVISLIGVLSGLTANIPLGLIVTQNVRLQGVTVGSREMHEHMAKAISKSKLEPVLDHHIYEFEDTAKAIAEFPSRGHFGKVCIRFE